MFSPTRNSPRKLNSFACACLVICWLLAGAPLRAQTETTASLGGAITGDDSKTEVAGARVTLRHAGTGDVFATRTNTAGQYLFIGLRPGEVYTMRVSAPGYDPEDVRDILLSLGEERRLDVALPDPAKKTVHLETFVVAARRENPQPGAATALSQREIEERPEIDHTINDYATADPRITMIDGENGEIAAAGQNFRFNSVQLDGIRMDDQFGLEYDGMPTLGNPFSMETIQAISVDLAPYEVTRGGFTGAAINAVSKSGNNDFSGSIYYSYRNEKFRAATLDTTTGERKRTPFTNENYGFVLSGPIVKNHLFFIISWDRTNNTSPSREDGFIPASADVVRIVQIARDQYGYDAGTLYNPGSKPKKIDRYSAKIDWRITAQHRLSVRYNGSHGSTPAFSDFGGSTTTSLSSHWLSNKRSLDGWSAQLFSKWHDSFLTEISFTQQHVKADRIPNAPWPDVHINAISAADGGKGGSIWIGTGAWDQANHLSTKNSQARIVATWLLGKHKIEFGAEQVRSRFENTYLRYAWGRYTFADIDSFEAGAPNAFTFQYTDSGGIPVADWGYAVNSAYVQDTWRPTRSLKLTAGVRLDYPSMSDRPRENPTFAQTFGMRNDGNIDGAYTIGPRFSFDWTPGRAKRLTLRGGAGIFQGRAPGSWMSNAFTEDGMSAYQVSLTGKSVPAFSTNLNNRPPLDPDSVEMAVNLMKPKLRLPAIMRGNLAADLRLPWQRMTATVEWLYSRSYNSLVYRNLNLRQTGTGPDGRPLYGTWIIAANGTISHKPDSQILYSKKNGTGYDGPSFDDVYMLTNADRGKDNSTSSYLTFMLKRPVQNHWGFNISYTRGHATEVAPFSESKAQANYGRRVSIDSNSDETGTSNTEVRDRILTTLTFNFALIRKFDTNLQFTYDAHSGRPYSFSFTNDANGDGTTPATNDLFYVPAGPNDTKIYWASQEDKDRFFAYLATNDSLRRYAGQIVPRNSERCQFQHRVDLRLTQQIPMWRKLRGEFVFTILNLTNLLNNRWGEAYSYGSPYVMPIAASHYDARTNQYMYSFEKSPHAQTLQTSASRWQIQAGVKVKF